MKKRQIAKGFINVLVRKHIELYFTKTFFFFNAYTLLEILGQKKNLHFEYTFK